MFKPIVKRLSAFAFLSALLSVPLMAQDQEPALNEGLNGQTVADPVPPPTRTLPSVLRPPLAPRPTQPRTPLSSPSEGAETALGQNALPALKFEATPSEMVLQAYAQETGRTLLLAPDVPKANITLKSQSALTREEWLEAIEKSLNLNGIALMPDGTKFLKVVPTKDIRTRAIETRLTDPDDKAFPEDGKMVSQMVQLKHITMDEARKTLEGFKRADGQMQLFERTNSILITDTSENINRMLEIIKFVDQPLSVREEVHVRAILFAKAADIKKRLEEIVAESQKQQQSKEAPQARPAGAPGIVRPPVTLPGVIRSTAQPATAAVENAVLETLVGDAERGVIRGKVQIIADDRTNKLIIITNPENIKFFENIINVLDVETAPDVTVEVMRLEHADAEEVAKMINDLIGNATRKDDAPTVAGGAAAGGETRAQPLAEAAEARRRAAASRTGTQQSEGSGTTKVGELNKDNIKVLADKRINGIIIMASQSDIAQIKSIISSMDIMLSQVLIETVVLEVSLGDSLKAGIDWVRTINKNNFAYDKDLNQFYLPEVPTTTGLLMGGAGDTAVMGLLTNVSSIASKAVSGIAYYFKPSGLPIEAVINASSTDSRTKILASPVLQTMDNKEATIKATQLVYLFNGKKAVYVADKYTYEEDYVQKEIGITVTVTPRINAKGNVVMTVKQTFQDKGAPQEVSQGGTKAEYATTVTRELNADVIAENGQTIVLGGLVRKAQTTGKSGIPFLSSLPFIGWLFGKTSNVEDRSELMVFLTPYVFATQKEAAEEAARRRSALGKAADGLWTDDWSRSPIAEPLPAEEVMRAEKMRINREKEAAKSQRQLEKIWAAEQKEKAKATKEGD